MDLRGPWGDDDEHAEPRMTSAARAGRDEIKALIETFQRVAHAEMKDPPAKLGEISEDQLVEKR
jgi:hypothetical protein